MYIISLTARNKVLNDDYYFQASLKFDNNLFVRYLYIYINIYCKRFTMKINISYVFVYLYDDLRYTSVVINEC